jgi:iron-sulfur cluster repair protein YtfE (RIC family)
MKPPRVAEVADDLSLAVRTGLPDALRVLLADYPREGWESHPNFTALTRFWLDRHLMFRQLQGMLIAETRGLIDADREPRVFAGRLARLGNMLLGDLHGHHTIEDLHFFPRLQRLDARLASGFDRLEADHQEIDPLLQTLAERANAVLAAIRDGAPTADAAGSLEAELVRLRGFLDRHLTDEEELVVPVILANPGAALD